MKSRQITTAIVILFIILINGNEVRTCGKRLFNHEALITRGWLSKEGDWPWHVAIHHISIAGSKYICGGSVLTSYSILTAAHCVPISESPETFSIYLGIQNLADPGSNLNSIQVIYIVLLEISFKKPMHRPST